MSSPYPILDNRPIDKWKVTELKEELKRRKLTTRGLKEDLIKRLDEALRTENAERSAKTGEGGDGDAETTPLAGQTTSSIGKAMTATDQLAPVTNVPSPFAGETSPGATETGLVVGETGLVSVERTPVGCETKVVTAETTPVAVETSPVAAKMEDNLMKNAGSKDLKVGDVRNKVDIDNPVVDRYQGKIQEGYIKDETDTPKVEPGTATEMASSEHDLHDSVMEEEPTDLDTQLDKEDSKVLTEPEGLKTQLMDGLHDASATPNNQVPEVSPVSGFEVKSDCISTDSVSNNENIELKDNIIADNVKLEHNVVKSEEMVEPSSVGGESHPMDVEEPLEKKATVGDRDDNNAANADVIKGNDYNVDLGDSEKLNLDRTSGDDSMEEDVDTKQIDSNNSDEAGNKSEKSEVSSVKVGKPVDDVGNDSVAGKGDLPDSKNRPVMTSEKRKLLGNDQEPVGNNEPVKRQRRWNSENIKVPDAQASNSIPATTPKKMALKRNIPRSDSSASDDGLKERIVPPSQKEPTNSLRIDRFLRPFTLKAVQELLGKTGIVTSFWMDHIKTHCYVTYSSVEEAMETRNSVYNLQWPPNGGRLLIAEFVDPEEVKAKVEAPPTPTTPAAPPSHPQPQPQPLPQPQPQPQPQPSQLPPTALPPPPPPPPPPPLSNPPTIREQLPPPPPVQEKQDPPIVTLDDLFKKTKATPRIYYLPLSEDQVAAKLASQRKGTK